MQEIAKLPLLRLTNRIPAWLRRTLLWAALVVWFSFGALLLALRYSVLPNIENYREDIAGMLSSSLGSKVSIEKIDANWHGLHPQLGLNGLRIFDKNGQQALGFERVDTELSWSSLWHWGLVLERLEIDAPLLEIRRETDGRIFVGGIELHTETAGTDFSDWLLAQRNIIVRNATIEWRDEKRQAPPLLLQQLDFHLENRGARHRFGLTAEPPPQLSSRLDVRGDLRGKSMDRLADWQGEAYAALEYADLSVWRTWVDYPIDLPQGAGGMRLWLGVDSGRLASINADVALRSVRLRMGKELPMLDLVSLQGRLMLQLPETGFEAGFETGGKGLMLETLDGIHIAPTDFKVRRTTAQEGKPEQGEVSADKVDLQALARLAAYLPLTEAMRKRLTDYAPQGKLFDFKFGWSGSDPQQVSGYNIRARFENIGLRAQDRWPGLSGMSGSIEGSNKGGNLTLASQNAALELPMVFAEPHLELDHLTAQANWSSVNDQVEMRVHNLTFDNKDAAGSASGSYRTSSADASLGANLGEIDVTGQLTRGIGTSVWRYVPLNISAGLRDWLREAITTGHVDDMRLRIKGNLQDLPFAESRPVTFRIASKFSGAALRYDPAWPEINEVNGEFLLDGKSLMVKAKQGKIFGTNLTEVSAAVPDILTPAEIIKIEGKVTGATTDFLRFIDSTSVSEKIDYFTEGMRAEGNGNLQLSLVLPLDKPADITLNGDYRFVNNRLITDPDLPPLTEVNGRLQFTEKTVTTRNIAANMLGSPMTLNATTRDGAVVITAAGSASVVNLRKSFDSPLLEHLSGATTWHGNIVVRKKNAEVTLESDLRGITSSLPEPFNKTTNDSLPLRFERLPVIELQQAPRRRTETARREAQLDQTKLSLGQVLNVHLVRRHQDGKSAVERGAITVGTVGTTGIKDAPLLPARGVTLNANLHAFNYEQWRRLLALSDDGTALPLTLPLSAINLKSGELSAFGQHVADLDLHASLNEGVWQARVNSRELNGDLSWSGGGSQGQERGRLRARLKNLSLAEVKPVPTEAASAAPTADGQPRELPGLDIVADSFSLRGKPLGKLELLAANHASGWRIEKLSLINPDGALSADGQWRLAQAVPDVQINFKLESGNAGKLLERFGYPDALKRGTATIAGKLNWKGAPTEIDQATLSGEFKLDAASGQFNKLEPGVGRLLGILSLQSLPRRISLDFRDVFSEGFAFDSISGDIKVARGVMTTDKLQIRGPSAKIIMSGEASLANETQNLRVRVQPALGESVAIGAMLANPAIGAAAYLAQKILQDPLDQIFAFEYQVTGGWADPKVEKIAANSPQPAPQFAPQPH